MYWNGRTLWEDGRVPPPLDPPPLPSPSNTSLGIPPRITQNRSPVAAGPRRSAAMGAGIQPPTEALPMDLLCAMAADPDPALAGHRRVVIPPSSLPTSGQPHLREHSAA